MKLLVIAMILSVASFAENCDEHRKPEAVTPEPSTLILGGIGIGGVLLLGARRKKR